MCVTSSIKVASVFELLLISIRIFAEQVSNMEEGISKYVKSGVVDGTSEEEGENWTFVRSEDISCTKTNNTNQHEDSSDNYSEQGSDSGSSIVVIDSSSAVPVCDTQPVLGKPLIFSSISKIL